MKSVFILFIAVFCCMLYGQIICLDAGHGGSDPGAVGNGLQEKTINLDVIKRLADILRRKGYTVKFTRGGDSFVSLSGRTNYANSIGASRFISVHCNAFNHSAHGTETFAYTQGSSTSFSLRNNVHPKLVRALNTRDRGTKTANFYVIKHTNMPAILCELAFIDNSSDAAKLGDSFYRQKAAQAIADGLVQTAGLVAEENFSRFYIAPRWSDSGDSLIVSNPGLKKHYLLKLSGEITTFNEKMSISSVFCEEGELSLDTKEVALKNDYIYRAVSSADGKNIAFEALYGGIYICDQDGNKVQHIAKGNNPSWSKDGQTLVFDQSIDNGHKIVSSNLIMVQLKNPKKLISLTKGLLTQGYENFLDDFIAQRPSLSPDGKKIAFDLNGKIFVADMAGQSLENLQQIK